MNSTPLPHGEHTCNTCQVSLRSFDAIRSHYGSELHLLNVKKRVCGDRSTLPTNTVSSTATTVSRFFCSLCKKTFHCARTLQDHVLSKGHKLAKAQAMEQRSERLSSKSEHQAMETSDGDQDAARISQQQEKETETVTVLHCFFCSHTFQTLDQNLNHMQRKHHFVLPHPEHLKDKEGLLQYLVRKINGYLCIVCAEHTKEFSNLRALQRHMLHTGHTCLELTEEYEEFYHPKLFEEQRQKNEPFEIVITQRGRELMRRGTVVATDSNAARCLDGMTTDGEILIQRPHCSAFDLLPQRVTRGSMLSICDRVAHHHAVEQQKKQVRDCRKDVAALNKQWMNVGVKMNKLHPKGYDGEGKV